MSRAIFDELSQDVRFKITLPIYITSFSPTFQASAISYSIFSTFATIRQLSPQPWFLGPHFFAYTHRINFPQLMFLQYMLKHVWTSLNYVCYVLLSVIHSIWPLEVISNICSYAVHNLSLRDRPGAPRKWVDWMAADCEYCALVDPCLAIFFSRVWAKNGRNAARAMRNLVDSALFLVYKNRAYVRLCFFSRVRVRGINRRSLKSFELDFLGCQVFDFCSLACCFSEFPM